MKDETLIKTLYELTMKTIDGFREYGRIEQIEDEIKKFKQDTVFSVFGLDDPRFIYARVGGGFVQSVTRRLGTLFEKYVKEIIKSKLKLSDSDIKYSANISGHVRELEVVIYLNKLSDEIDRLRLKKIIEKHEKIFIKEYIGIGFEVRYAYTIGDSKRIQADEDMAKHLIKNNILPVMLVFSTVNLEEPLKRLGKYWRVKIGDEAFNFLKLLTGFDLKWFLLKYKDEIRSRVREILNDVFR